MNDILEEKLKIHLHKDLLETLDYDKRLVTTFLEDLYEIHSAALLTTTTVYLRKDCMSCLMVRAILPLMEWVNTIGYKILTEDEDVPQFQRQVAIFTKEWAEEQMKSPCSSDASSGKLH